MVDPYNLLLIFTDPLVIYPLLFLCLLVVKNRHNVLYLVTCMGFSTVLSRFLKAIYQIPLEPAYGKIGWAYPSGHTMVAYTMWFWCILTYWSLLQPHWRKCLLLVVAGIFSTVIGMGHFHYHRPYQVLASLPIAAGVALLTVAFQGIQRGTFCFYRVTLATMTLELGMIAYLAQYGYWIHLTRTVSFCAGMGLATRLSLRAQLGLGVLLLGMGVGLQAPHPSAVCQFAGAAIMIWRCAEVFQKRLWQRETAASRD